MDLREAFRWYEEQHSGLGGELLDEVSRAITCLEQHADRHPPYYRNFRRLMMRRFPYKLFYRIEKDQVIVFRTLHAKRDHRRWV